MSGTTPNIGLNVPDHGDQNWDVPVNQNWNTLDTVIAGKQATLVSGTNIKTINNNPILGSGNVDIDALPSQTGQNGKFLSTNGTNASWANVPTRNIGEIVESTIPLSDAGLHLLDGSVISGSGAYSAFVTYIAGLVSGHSELFTTEANWQTSVTNYGACGKFVYDSVNNTVRLPKIIGFTESTIDPIMLGDLTEAGLPNITGAWKSAYNINQANSSECEGALYAPYGTSPGYYGGSGAGADWGYGIKLDASYSNSIYGNSATVQPQAIKVLYYIVIATSTKTDIQVDIDEVMTDLNGKVDIVDLATCHVVVETYVNGTSWYRVYSDGWCEQGGQLTTTNANTTVTVNLLKTFVDTNYTVNAIQFRDGTTGEYNANVYVVQKYTSSIDIYGQHPYTLWMACGYIR